MDCSVKNRLGSWDYYRSSQSPSLSPSTSQVSLDNALPSLPSDAHLVGQGKVVKGTVCKGSSGLGDIPGEAVTLGTWAILGLVGIVLWKVYG